MPAAALLIGPMIANNERRSVPGRFTLKLFLILVTSCYVDSGGCVSSNSSSSVGGWFRFGPLLVAAIGLIGTLYELRRTALHAAITLIVVIWAMILTYI